MKIKFLSTSILLASAFIFLSCKKTADNIDYPEYTPRLVLHSYISPSDTVLTVNVSTTVNVFGNLTDYPKFLPVKVNLVDGETIIPFSERDTSGNCFLKYTIEAGKQYKIMANCPGYPDISGTCKVPEIRNFDISVDTFTVIKLYDWGNDKQGKVRIRFNDIPNEVNYYAIAEAARVKYTSESTEFMFMLYENDSYHDISLISDNLMDGKVLSSTFTSMGGGFRLDSYIIELNTYLMAVDADYYKYNTSLYSYKGSDDPFTEFSPVYSNIEGGYGIFCAYVKYKKTLKLK